MIRWTTLTTTEGAIESQPPWTGPWVGRTLAGKWRVERLVGVGGMSAVFEASHRNGLRVAVKMLHPEHALKPLSQQRFLREGYLANRVGHPGAIVVLDDGVTDDGTPFLVMELLAGETLDRRWKTAGGRLEEAEALHVAERVLDVLVAAHQQGIVHRDLKPSNVFLTAEGLVKLIDFGIAGLRSISSQPIQLTGSGASLGTPAFMAPEQARGDFRDVDARTDLWAVGATMFTVLAGRTVYQRDSLQASLLAAGTQRAPALQSVATWVSGAVAAIVDRALMVDREARWQSAAAMRAAVRDARASASSGVVPSRSSVDTRGSETSSTDTSTVNDSQVAALGTHTRARALRWVPWTMVGVIASVVLVVFVGSRPSKYVSDHPAAGISVAAPSRVPPESAPATPLFAEESSATPAPPSSATDASAATVSPRVAGSTTSKISIQRPTPHQPSPEATRSSAPLVPEDDFLNRMR